jgi:hypothetical protein
MSTTENNQLLYRLIVKSYHTFLKGPWRNKQVSFYHRYILVHSFYIVVDSLSTFSGFRVIFTLVYCLAERKVLKEDKVLKCHRNLLQMLKNATKLGLLVQTGLHIIN